MSRRFVRISGIAAVAMVLAALPGLVTCDRANPEELFVYDMMAMNTQNQCVIRPGQTAQIIRLWGVLDLMITNQYWAFPRFKNMMQPINSITGEGPTTPEVESHYISVQRAKTYVDYGVAELAPTSANEAALAQTYQIDGVESFVTAGVGPNTDGAVGVQVIPPELGNVFDTKIQALVKKGVKNPAIWVTVYVTLYGQTQDQQVIRSNELSYPIELCWGCLVLPSCPLSITEFPCYLGQDDPLYANVCPYVSNHPDSCYPVCPPP